MKHFLLKVVLFCLPIALFYLFPITVVFLSKEYYTVPTVVAIQNATRHTLYGNVYNTGSFIPYKQLLVDTNNPDIVTLGTSRALQIRTEFFNLHTHFINAGLAGRSVSDMKYFIESLPQDTKVKTILLVVDRDTFLRIPGEGDDRVESPLSILGFKFFLPLSTARGMYLDYFLRHKYSLKNLFLNAKEIDTLGMKAFADGNGFRFDGSYRNYLESQDKNLIPRIQGEVAVVAENIVKARNTPPDGSVNIEPNLATFNEVLDTAKLRGITIVGFIPPYPSPINKADHETDLTNHIAADFKSHNFPFYDLSDISLYGGKDSEFLDTIHGTDLIYAKASLYLATHDKVMSKYFDAAALRNLISNAKNNFLSL